MAHLFYANEFKRTLTFFPLEMLKIEKYRWICKKRPAKNPPLMENKLMEDGKKKNPTITLVI